MSSKQTKNNAFQGLRAVAFLGIVICHAEIGDFAYLGAWGVSVFLVLSGFLMLYNYFPRNINLKNGFCFACNKISNLYILHIVAMLLYAAYVIQAGESIVRTIINMTLHSLLIQSWIPNSMYYATLNSPSWYLGVTFFCYMLFPCILKFFKEKMSKKRVIFFICALFSFEIVLSILTIFLGNHEGTSWFSTQWMTYYFPPVRLADFLLGCCLGYLFLNKKEFKKIYLYEIILVALIALSMTIYAYSTPAMKSVKYTLLFLPTTLCLIWVIASNRGILAKALASKPLVWLGNISAYTFLIHGVAIRYVNAVLKNKLSIENKGFIFIVILVLTIAPAVCWARLSKWFKNKKIKQ